MPIFMLEILLAVVKLPQLPLLLFLKCHVHDDRCAGAVAAAVRRRVPDDAICCCGLLQLIPVFFLFIQTRFVFNAAPLAVLSRV